MSLRSVALAFVLVAAASGCSSAADEDDGVVADDAALTGDALSGSLPAGTRLTTTANVNFRSAARIADNVLRVVRRGSEVTAVGGPAQDGFYAVTYQGAQGFVSARYLARVSGGSPHDAATGDYRVTYIGDSHSDFEQSGGSFGTLGYRVAQRLAEENVPLALFAASSSAPNWWLDGTSEQAATWGYTQTVSTPARRTCTRGSKTGPCVPKLSAILSERPSLFVIEQGSNLFGRTTADVTNQVRSMIHQIDDKVDACLWVAAPTARTDQASTSEQEDVFRIISANAAPRCYVYDSRFLPRTDEAGKPVLDASGNLVMDVPMPYAESHGDGVHFGAAAGARWGDGVMIMIDWIRSRGH